MERIRYLRIMGLFQGVVAGRGLHFVHFSAQSKPFWSLWPCIHPTYHAKSAHVKRKVHSSTFQLNLSRFCHCDPQNHPTHLPKSAHVKPNSGRV